MLQEQFLDLKDFALLDLVNPHCFINWKNSVPVEKLELSERRYGPLFKLSLLKQQLLFIYRDSDFHKASSQELLDRVQKNFKPSSGTHFFIPSLPHYTALM